MYSKNGHILIPWLSAYIVMIKFFMTWMIWVRHLRYLKAGPEFTWFQLIKLWGAFRGAFINAFW